MTKLTTAQITELTAALTNQPVGKANTKDAAVKRFLKATAQAGIDGEAILAADEPLAAMMDALKPAAPKPAEKKLRARRAITAPTGGNLAPAPRLRKGETLRADGLIDGGVDALLVDTVKRDGGALHSELCAIVGWKKCDRRLGRAAEIAGLRLIVAREGRDQRFSIAA